MNWIKRLFVKLFGVRCPECGGAGYVNYIVRPSGTDRDVWETWTCERCNGKGRCCDTQELHERDKAQDALKNYIAELEAEVTKCHELQDSYCDRIAELEGFIDQLIEIGEWGVTGMVIATSFSGGEIHDLAERRQNEWLTLVKDWKEREE